MIWENIGKTVFDKNHKIFFDPPPRVMKIKTKINKWDLIKLQSFCTAKETINEMKRQPSEWDKIFANETMDKGSISRIIFNFCLVYHFYTIFSGKTTIKAKEK